MFFLKKKSSFPQLTQLKTCCFLVFDTIKRACGCEDVLLLDASGGSTQKFLLVVFLLVFVVCTEDIGSFIR